MSSQGVFSFHRWRFIWSLLEKSENKSKYLWKNKITFILYTFFVFWNNITFHAERYYILDATDYIITYSESSVIFPPVCYYTKNINWMIITLADIKHFFCVIIIIWRMKPTKRQIYLTLFRTYFFKYFFFNHNNLKNETDEKAIVF